MNLARSTAKNTLVGVVVAFVLAASTATMVADGCPVETTCAPGQPLSGFTIGCDCMGPGSCFVISAGYGVLCECDHFDPTVCDCVQGCYKRPM